MLVLALEALATESSLEAGHIPAPQAINFISVEISWLDLVNQRCQYLNWVSLPVFFSFFVARFNALKKKKREREQARERCVCASPWLSPSRVQGHCDDVMTILKRTSICFKVFWFFMVALRERTLWLQLY